MVIQNWITEKRLRIAETLVFIELFDFFESGLELLKHCVLRKSFNFFFVFQVLIARPNNYKYGAFQVGATNILCFH